MLILGGLFLLIVGLLMLIFPDLVYAITESWKNNSFSKKHRENPFRDR